MYLRAEGKERRRRFARPADRPTIDAGQGPFNEACAVRGRIAQPGGQGLGKHLESGSMNTVERIEQVIRMLDPEVWILAAEAGAVRGGLTATAVRPAHIDREHPTLLISLGSDHHTTELVDHSGQFVAHLLEPQQAEVGWNFAADSGRDRDKWAGMAAARTPSGALRLATCCAWLECRVYARLATGDRVYYWSDIVDGETCSDQPPLRLHEFMNQLSPEQRATLGHLQRDDVRRQHPRWEAWRREIPDLLRPRQEGPVE